MSDGRFERMELTEADVVVNGRRLSTAQSMAVRVAVASMLMDLAEPEYMRDMGEIGPLYQARLGEVQALLLGGRP